MWSAVLPILLATAAISTLAGFLVVSFQDETIGEDHQDNLVCFDGLDCFEVGEPWHSPLRPVPPPERPEKIPTTLFFFSRQNLNQPFLIKTYPDIQIGDIPFEGDRPTVIIIHGTGTNATAAWMTTLKDVYLDKYNANVFIVDWSVGAMKEYLRSVSNARVVGRVISKVLKLLMDLKGLKPEMVHLIGHSLGAHICSYIGKETPGIGRLTALDPAQPGFEGYDVKIRLDKSDAAFVEVLHTDAKPFIPLLGFGMMAPHGHVDFYFNLAPEQPGCLLPDVKDYKPEIKSLADVVMFPIDFAYWQFMCSHERVHEYLIESYLSKECVFWGHKASLSNAARLAANSLTKGIFSELKVHSKACTPLDCVPLGFDTIDTSLRGIFLVTTNSKPPFCVPEPGLLPTPKLETV